MPKFTIANCCSWCGVESKDVSRPEVTHPEDTKLTLCNKCVQTYYQCLVHFVLGYNCSKVTIKDSTSGDAFKQTACLFRQEHFLENTKGKKNHSELAKKAMEVL